jgi:hypothetical protein
MPVKATIATVAIPNQSGRWVANRIISLPLPVRIADCHETVARRHNP